jgi:hypothetical protein
MHGYVSMLYETYRQPKPCQAAQAGTFEISSQTTAKYRGEARWNNVWQALFLQQR